jgi:hypothetical protein
MQILYANLVPEKSREGLMVGSTVICLRIEQYSRSKAVQTVPLGLDRSALLAIFGLFSISWLSAVRLFFL